MFKAQKRLLISPDPFFTSSLYFSFPKPSSRQSVLILTFWFLLHLQIRHHMLKEITKIVNLLKKKRIVI